MSLQCDWVFEAAMMSDEMIRLAPEISSLKEKGVSEDAAIRQSSKERAEILYVCGDNRCTEKLAPLSCFRRVRDESLCLCDETYLLSSIYGD